VTEHKQVVVGWQGRSAEVDEGLAALILALWQKDIDTVMSCQENFPGVVWVMFRTPVDARRFLDLTDYTIEWKFDVYPRDMAPLLRSPEVTSRLAPEEAEKLSQLVGEGTFFELRVSVRFPAADLPRVMERVGGKVQQETPARRRKSSRSRSTAVAT
jgi:hypothetical protein